MRILLALLICIPLWSHGHSPQISTFALVKDANGQWTAHVSASLDAFEYALAKKEVRSADEFQTELIQYLKGAIQFSSGILNPILLQEGQCHLGHQTDVKFTVIGIPKQVESFTVENQIFKKLNNHFIIFKVIDDKNESSQFVLNSMNDFSAKVSFNPTGITIDAPNTIDYSFLFIILPLLFLPILIYKMKKSTVLAFLGVFLFSCSQDETEMSPTNDYPVAAVYKKIYGASSITSDGTFITIKTKDLPDHKSPYYPTTNSLYQSYSGPTFGGFDFVKNPNSIIEQSGTFKIPINPKVATNHVATPLGPIGIALNGVPFFNQYAGPNNQELKGEMASFDQFYGHPQQSGVYHYHVEPLHLTTVKSTKSGLMGFLLDGFPVYGPKEENGSPVSNANLDSYHGHTHATIDYPDGIYHYHFTAEAPYLNGNGFYGTPGTVSQ